VNIPEVPQLPEQFVCEAPAFVLDYIRDVMAWGNMGWNRAQEKEARVAELENRLRDIGDIAHTQSTGPAEPDWLWHIRELAYELL